MVLDRIFTIADWTVDPDSNEVAAHGERARLEPRVMDLLVYLAERQGEVLTRTQIFRDVWHDAEVGEGALTTAISSLRRILKDDPRRPKIIETVHKRGYRLIAPSNARSAALAVLPLRDLSLHRKADLTINYALKSLSINMFALWRASIVYLGSTFFPMKINSKTSA